MSGECSPVNFYDNLVDMFLHANMPSQAPLWSSKLTAFIFRFYTSDYTKNLLAIALVIGHWLSVIGIQHSLCLCRRTVRRLICLSMSVLLGLLGYSACIRTWFCKRAFCLNRTVMTILDGILGRMVKLFFGSNRYYVSFQV